MIENVSIKEVPLETVWRIRQEVMWRDKPLSFVKLELDYTAKHIGLLRNQEVKSVVSLFQKNDELQFRKFATIESEQGKGFGTMLLNHVFQFVEKNNITRIWCNARQKKIGYYQRFGMFITSEPYDKEGIMYVTMEKTY